MNYVNYKNMEELLEGLAKKIGGGGTGNGLQDWQPSNEYTYNDICVYDGQIYKAIVSFTSDTSFSTTEILEEYTPIGGETFIPYVKDTEITIGDLVSYDTKYYTALEDFTCGEDFSLYALEEYVPIELTQAQEQEIINHFIPNIVEDSGMMLVDTVGHITWQMHLMKDYLKLDGTTLANASTDYHDLLKFAQDNSLITSDITDKSLFKYDSTTDVLTLPDYIGLCLQGGNIVEEKEAGLPNIKGECSLSAATGLVFSNALFTGPFRAGSSTYAYLSQGYAESSKSLEFNANKANPIYSDSVDTVQPPAIQLIPQIKYRKSATTVEMGKFVASAPAHYEREQLYTTNKTIITIYPTWININGHGYVLEGTKIIDLTNADNWDDNQYITASNRAGKDFYIYACESENDAPDFVLSANSSYPTGYTLNNSRKMGGFHCLCVDVGTISGHTLSGYVAGDILPNSSWDLNFRANSDNEGMVYVKPINMWVDIYLSSWETDKLVSKFSGVPITGVTTPPMNAFLFIENYANIGKVLPYYDEFIIWARGSEEGVSLYGGSAPTETGGHNNTAGSRIISNFGIEDSIGVLNQWLRDNAENYPSSTYTAGNYSLSGYTKIDNPVYNSNIDSVKRGTCYSLMRRYLAGGDWGDATNVGSRLVSTNIFGTSLVNFISARGCSTPRIGK